jgi:hypothetical protein
MERYLMALREWILDRNEFKRIEDAMKLLDHHGFGIILKNVKETVYENNENCN